MIRRFSRAAALGALLILLLAPAACSDGPGTPAPSPSSLPSAASVPDYFSIAFNVPNSIDSTYAANIATCMGRLQKLLNDRGWKVRLQLKLIDVTDGVAVAEERMIRAEIAAGSACDGYLISPEAAVNLNKAGLTLDPADTVRTEAPALYTRYKQYFDGGAAGLPAYIQTQTKSYPATLYLPKEITDAVGIQSVSDVFGWLERTDPKWKIGAYTTYSYVFRNLLDAWAGEKGYYPMSICGMSGMMYAAYDDNACTPVPIENIAGFQTFADRCTALISGGRIINYDQMPDLNSAAVCGYIGPLNTDMDEQFLLRLNRTGNDFVAYPLRGCAQPDRPQEEASVHEVCAMPVVSACTLQTVKLLEWFATDTDGYALTNYGEPNVDYRIVNGLLEPLYEGRPLTVEDWDYQTRKAFSVISPTLFREDSRIYPTVYRVSNYTEASSFKVQYPPLLNITPLRDYSYVSTPFDDINTQMQPTIQERKDLISGLVANGFLPEIRELYAERLKAIKADTDKLARLYADRIEDLRSGRATGTAAP